MRSLEVFREIDSMENLLSFFFLINLLCFELGCGWLAVSSPVSTNSFCPVVSCWCCASSFTGMPTSMIKAGALKVAVTGRNPGQRDDSNWFIPFDPPVPYLWLRSVNLHYSWWEVGGRKGSERWRKDHPVSFRKALLLPRCQRRIMAYEKEGLNQFNNLSLQPATSWRKWELLDT